MPKFIFAYHGGTMPETPEEGKKEMARWEDYMQSNKDAFVDQGAPVGKSKTVSPDDVADNGGSNPLMGYSVVEVPSMDAAVALAKKSPMNAGASVEVAEIIEM